MGTLAETLTEQFYAWEQRGRGWQVHNFRVALEPPFVPFVRGLPQRQGSEDDGRRPTIFGQIATWWKRRKAASPAPPPEDQFAADPARDGSDDEIVEIQIRLPPETNITGELADQLLLAVASVSPRASFELLGIAGRIILQLAVPAPQADAVRRTLEVYVPGAVLAAEATLQIAWEESRGEFAVVDFGLRNEFMLPLPVRRSLSIDPLLGFIAALDGLHEGELGMLQVLFQPARPEWAVSALRAMSDGEGRAFFADAPETLGLTREKLSRPLLACVVRVAACAANEERAWEVAKSLGRALMTLYGAGANDLIPLDDEEYDDYEHEDDVLERATHRSGMLLSSAELSGLVHLPAATVEADDLRASGVSTRAVPSDLSQGEVLLGSNVHRGRSTPVWLRSADRMRHMHLIGATGTGKSTLLLSLIRQDLEAGRGVGLLDPHGDLADEVLALVPSGREAEVVLFDPSDEEFPVGFNVIGARSDRERELLASDLVAIFRRFSTTWGDQMSSVLGNAVLAFLDSPEGGSLLDLRQFLLSKETRDRVLASGADPLVASFWREQFPRLAGRPQTPILTRLDAFLRPRSIRNVVCQKKSGFDLAEIMDSGGIFIARLSQGAIGEQNAHLLGSLLVAKFQQAAMARESKAEESRRPFHLCLDEFHHFTTPSVAALLSGARKYRLGLVLAHQELRQLEEHDIRSAVLANAGTRVCFRVGDEDARTLAAGFRSFDGRDLMSLGVGEAICRAGQADRDFTLRTERTPPADEVKGRERRQTIRELSRRRCASDRAAVEAAIAAIFPSASTTVVTTSPVVPTRPEKVEEVAEAAPVLAGGVAAKAGVEAPRRSRAAPPAMPGKGGPEHKYLQSLIKSYAESKGFRATIEAPVGGGEGIDVLLEREKLRIACEISVTTGAEHETGNVRKSLLAGIERVVVVAPSPAALKRLETHVKASLAADEANRVLFFTPQDLIAYLDEQGPPGESEASTVRGYKVKTTLDAPGAGAAAEGHTVARTIVQALRRMRGK